MDAIDAGWHAKLVAEPGDARAQLGAAGLRSDIVETETGGLRMKKGSDSREAIAVDRLKELRRVKGWFYPPLHDASCLLISRSALREAPACGGGLSRWPSPH
jgi:hypothetical protein